MTQIVVAMVVIVLLAGVVVVYVAYPHRGEDLPGVPWLGRLMRKGAQSLPTVEPERGDVLPDGEVDIFEWYGNGSWPAGTTVHAASNGKTWEGKSIPELVDGNWHTWRMRWDQDGFKFWRDYVDGAEPYFSVPPKPIQVSGRPDDWRWPFNNPGYWLNPMFTLAVGGVGAGDPALGSFPAAMLIDWIRVW